MSASHVVIVESPAKAKTINKYLGTDYEVLASYGHVRDLPPKDGSVDPEKNFDMIWENSDRSKKTLKDITTSLKKADTLILATDPDREGEAISWHILEILRNQKLLKDKDVKRVTFNQITKASIQEAFAKPRDLDSDLIDAYLARRALDYLVGFNLSPILWRKLPGSRSAGRVQSVALRLIAERESEIEIFIPQEYWSIEGLLKKTSGETVPTRLTVLDNEKLDKFSLANEAAATKAVAAFEKAQLKVLSIQKKQTKRNPHPPFITSTLQQEASRKLGFGATKTMRTAQSLYEGIDIGGETVGLITYMRTDGITLSPEAVKECMDLVGKDFGDKYVPSSPRIYKSKSKNAQEAHEAIRPTSVNRKPETLRKKLSDDEYKLYDLIWKRTLASTMESAVLDQVSVDIGDPSIGIECRANGSVIAFDGFLKLYREDRDDDGDSSNDDDNKILPAMTEGEALKQDSVTPNQHFTQPPPRYTEASLVKKLEELGIGRPSTYASIIQVLQDRDYVTLDRKRFVPQDRGRIVTTFLEHFFPRYVEYDFTANLEDKLDEISGGNVDWKTVLRDFWDAFSATVEETKGLTITEVIDALDEDLGPHFFPKTEETPEPRKCPSCDDGRLGLKLGKFGAFIGCSNYPECKYTKQLAVPSKDDGADVVADGPKILGQDPDTGMDVSLRKGPYGFYVQLGPKDPEDKKEKPKRTAIPRGMDVQDVDFEKAQSLLSLPRDVGPHPDSGKMITAGIGRFGPYVKHESTFKSIPKDEDVLTIGFNRAVDLIATAAKKSSNELLKELGKLDKKDVNIHNGRYGPYVKYGKLMVSLPKGTKPEDVTLDQAKELIEKKLEKDKKTKTKKAKK